MVETAMPRESDLEFLSDGENKRLKADSRSDNEQHFLVTLCWGIRKMVNKEKQFHEIINLGALQNRLQSWQPLNSIMLMELLIVCCRYKY